MKNKNNEIRYICQTPFCRGREAVVIVLGKGMCAVHWEKYAQMPEVSP